MKELNVKLSSCCLMLGLFLGASCVDVERSEIAKGRDEVRTPYYELGSHFNPSDDLILTEFDAFGGPNIVNYPMCVYPESDGQEINDPMAVLSHMETVVNTWLPYLYKRWGFGVYSVRFSLQSTTEGGCEKTYDGFRPFSVSSYEGGAFGGMAKAIRVRFPGATINKFSNGKTHRQSILHEVGHVLGLMHTMGQSPISVMDYDDMHNMTGIGGDDIIGMTHAWKYLSEQVSRGECEFGYTGGPGCKPTDANLSPVQIRNMSTIQCIQSNGTGNGVPLVAAPCDGEGNQSFSFMRSANGWRLQLSKTTSCVQATTVSDGGLFTLTECDENSLMQDFTVLLNSPDTYMVRNEHSGMIVQIHDGNLEQSPPVGEITQTWRLEPPGTPCDELDCCPEDENKVQPGICGCGVSDVDEDGDGIPSCNDKCPADENKVRPGTCGCGEAEPLPGESLCPGSTTDDAGPDDTDDVDPDDTDDVDPDDTDDVDPDDTDDVMPDDTDDGNVVPGSGCTVSPISNNRWSCFKLLRLLDLLLLGR